jgi:hypothetical protein
MAVPNGTIIDAKWHYFNLWVANSYSCGYRNFQRAIGWPGKQGCWCFYLGTLWRHASMPTPAGSWPVPS